MNRPKRTYLTLTRPATQYRSAPMDGTCTGGIRAPNQEGQWETEVLKIGAGTGEVSSIGCDSGRGARGVDRREAQIKGFCREEN